MISSRVIPMFEPFEFPGFASSKSNFENVVTELHLTSPCSIIRRASTFCLKLYISTKISDIELSYYMFRPSSIKYLLFTHIAINHILFSGRRHTPFSPISAEGNRQNPDIPEHVYFAAGFGGNYIIIDKVNLLVVVTRWLEPSQLDGFQDILWRAFE